MLATHDDEKRGDIVTRTDTIPPGLYEMFSRYSDAKLSREIRDAKKRLADAEPYETTNHGAFAVADCARRHLYVMEIIRDSRKETS